MASASRATRGRQSGSDTAARGRNPSTPLNMVERQSEKGVLVLEVEFLVPSLDVVDRLEEEGGFLTPIGHAGEAPLVFRLALGDV